MNIGRLEIRERSCPTHEERCDCNHCLRDIVNRAEEISKKTYLFIEEEMLSKLAKEVLISRRQGV